jgi:hypothetical protein
MVRVSSSGISHVGATRWVASAKNVVLRVTSLVDQQEELRPNPALFLYE